MKASPTLRRRPLGWLPETREYGRTGMPQLTSQRPGGPHKQGGLQFPTAPPQGRAPSSNLREASQGCARGPCATGGEAGRVSLKASQAFTTAIIGATRRPRRPKALMASTLQLPVRICGDAPRLTTPATKCKFVNG